MTSTQASSPAIDDASTSGICLDTLFQRRRAEAPAAPAVVAPERTLSYEEVGRCADDLARRLTDLQARPDQLVAAVMDKGWEQVVAVLGVLGAGAAYLPIDPQLPPERMRHLLERCDVRVVITQPWLADTLSWLPATQLVTVGAGVPESRITSRPQRQPDPDRLAYVIFTSGSSGEPKGVMIDHRAATNTILDINRRFRIGSDDRVLALSSLTFDLSVYDIFGTLGAGAAIVLPPSTAARDPHAWAELVRDAGVTLWNSVPALAEMLVEYVAGRPECFGSTLRLMLLSGDWIPLSLPERVRSLFPGVHVVSLGGATEAAIWSIFYPVDRVDPGWDSIPYGRPLAEQDVHVLDQGLEPSATWVPGELYISGLGLARGYWRDPERTAESFIVHPTSGQRLYRTGDLGRRLPDGNIEFLGRCDLQVKIDGFRVELAEVDAALQAHPDVRLAATIAVGDRHESKRLVSYALSREGTDLSGQQLRSFVAGKLPPYMVPTACVVLDDLPLTPNGKVDRQRLPAPDWSALAGRQGYVEPRCSEEKAVASVWRELLALERISVTDDFFSLGANSLVATRAAARLQQLFGTDVPLPVVFQHPTVESLTRALRGAALTPEERRLVPRPQTRPAPLSLFQEQVSFLDRVTGTNAYNFQCTVHFRGKLDVPLLQRALNQVIARHEVLRTEFREVDGRRVQLVRSSYTVQLPIIDLTNVPAPDRMATAERLAREEFRTRFDVGTLPLLLWKLIILGPEEHLLVHVEHHFVHDGWSLALLWSEIEELYSASRVQRPPRLPELTIQYSDYALWQRERAHSTHWERLATFWRHRLADPPPPLELPVARPRPTRQTFAGDAYRVTVPFALYSALRRHSRAAGVSLFMTMHAGFVALLHRYTGRFDVWVGTGVANRTDPATLPVIGMMVNNVVLRTAVRPDMTFSELLCHVREVALAAYAHQDLPFEEVVRLANPPRDPRRNPLVQILFSFHDSAMPELDWPGVRGQLVERNNGTAKFDLNIITLPRGEQRGASRLDPDRDRLEMLWEYNSDLFDEATVARMAAHFVALLEGAMAEPTAPLSHLPLLTWGELHELRDDWNATTTAYPRDACVHELVERQAAATPDRVALTGRSGGGDYHHITYRELNGRANQLARRLCGLGVTTEVPVGVMLERSPEFVLSVLAVLKAGGAYLPLDPEYPAPRLAAMLSSTRTAVVVTRRRLVERLPVTDARLVYLDEQAHAVEGLPDTNLGVHVHAENLAYIVFTSGSTGVPKGVAVPHRGVLRLVTETDYARLAADEVILQVSSVSFDAATFEIWGALLHGARLVVAPPQPPSLVELGSLLRKHTVTTMFVTTGLFHLMVEDRLSDLGGLRQLLTGGDVLSVARIRRAAEALPGCQLIACYGPTENTTFTSCFPVPNGWGAARSVPIGRPIANTRMYVLDEHMQPLPVGVPGQLYVGGDGLARGYLADPALTAERFVPDPLAVTPGARLYATGDLARYLPGGVVEFLGRLDEQVKVRGFRVEPAEVEEVLRTHPDIRDVAVIPYGDSAESRRLAAYPVLSSAAGDPDSVVRNVGKWVRRQLPGYLVPDVWVPVDGLPLTANGKLDRRALPAPAGAALEHSGALPTESSDSLDGEERVIASVWAEVLRLDRVGRDEDFFRIGGHSLLAVKVVSRLREALGIEIPVSAIFDYPTVAQLAELIRDSG